MKTEILHGDCRELIAAMPDNSIDAIVTDPPYELGFMGKSWDSTGIAYNVELWRECLRVIKHGGHLLAFGGSRTYHRLACAIEDAGWQIRDQIMWVYGSGFPKSLNLKDNHAGWGTALKPSHEPIVMARKPLVGTVEQNVRTWGTGAINIDGTRIATTDAFGGGKKATSGCVNGYEHDGWVAGSQLGRWPANFIHDGSDEVLALFPDTKGGTAIRVNSGGNTFGGNNEKPPMENLGYGDSGSAARFFYCAKPSKAERNAGCEGLEEREAGIKNDSGRGFSESDPHRKIMARNHHPTVKPLALMRYLIRLVTPPNGTILDPFAGSGTTLVAAIMEHHPVIGCEMTADYLPIIKARTKWAEEQNTTDQPSLFGEPA